jgi:hypothetical protein
LITDLNAEARRRDAARSVLAARRQVGWARDDIPIPAMDSSDALEIIRTTGIVIGTLGKILVQNRRHLAHIETIRRALRLSVKRK